MIERFHRSLKSSLRAGLASSDKVAHLPLVMLGLRSLPKDHSGFSPAKAVYGSNLSLPGKFLEYSELPPESFLCKVDQAIQGSPDLLDITWSLSLSLYLFLELWWKLSMCLSGMTHQNLRCLFSCLFFTEDLIEFSGNLNKFVLFRLEINQILCLWTGWNLLYLQFW